MNVLVIDIGGNHVKLLATGQDEPVKFVSGPRLTPAQMVAGVKKLGRGVPTIDLRVDYHSPAMPGDLTVRGKVVRLGNQFSTAEAHVHDAQGKLVASGRGTYFTAPLKA